MKSLNLPTLNMRMVLRVLGWLLMIEGTFMSIPLATAACYHEADWLAFAISGGVTIIAGFLLNTCIHSPQKSMGKREGFLLTSLVWVVLSIFGMLPFLICTTPLSISDGFFEAMSGFTTTGATIIPDIERYSHGIHIWRALMQWIGGMGIILFTLAVLPMLNHSGGMQLFNAEVTGITHDKIRPRISQTAKSLWGVYISLTILCAGLLWLGPMSLYDSLCHAFGTVSTGGLSTQNTGLNAWESNYVKVIVTLFMFLGGTNFALIFKAAHSDFSPIRTNGIFRVYIGCVAVYTILFIISIAFQGHISSWHQVSIDPLFQVVSIMTSTGYVLDGVDCWGALALALMLVLMFFGASAGSTSGGAKLDRMLVMLKFSRNELRRSLQPYNITSVKVSRRVMSPETVMKVVAFLCFYVMLITIGGIILSALGTPLADSFFSALTCISNVGIDASVTGYGSQFVSMNDIAKFVLCALMLIGRLEVFTVLVLFSPNFWRK